MASDDKHLLFSELMKESRNERVMLFVIKRHHPSQPSHPGGAWTLTLGKYGLVKGQKVTESGLQKVDTHGMGEGK
jgi:hypothetical protein